MGQTIAIPFGKIACPAAALKKWITAAGIGSGALFRSVNRHGKVGERLTDQSVSDVVKEHAERLRLDPKQFAGNSLRAGFLTSAASRGASIFKMMDVSRHRSVTRCAAMFATPSCSRITPERGCFRDLVLIGGQ